MPPSSELNTNTDIFNTHRTSSITFENVQCLGYNTSNILKVDLLSSMAANKKEGRGERNICSCNNSYLKMETKLHLTAHFRQMTYSTSGISRFLPS
jgi:hypothetical protein